jgi:hypothetical protein
MIAFFILAIIGFLASVLVHASTFLDRPPLGMNQTWPLHVGIFLVFIPSVLAQRRTGGNPHPQSLREQFPLAPRWMQAILGLCFAYAIVNFAIFMIMSFGNAARASKAEPRDGRYVVTRSGVVVEEFTETQYRRAQGRIVRGFSGHWMIFYWASAVGTLDGLRRRRAEDAARPKPPPLRPTARTSTTYALNPAPRLSPWAHATVQSLLAFTCFFGFPLAVIVPLLHFQHAIGGAGCVITVLFFPAAFTGLFLPAKLFARYVPARCPNCNGRTFGRAFPFPDRNQAEPPTYTCRDCGHVYQLGGHVV